LSERELIERLRRRAGSPPSWITIGIGDDAAVIEPDRGALSVFTTDSLVEDIHFRRAWTPLGAVGHKAAAVNLSDLAAMGATPRAALLSLVLPDTLTLAEFDELVDAFLAATAAAGAALIGGNLARSPAGLVVDATFIGSVGRRRVLTRAGGKPGDELFVTGTLGGAAAGLGMLRSGLGRAALEADARRRVCLERYERPAARVRCGTVVGRGRAATACVDLSDGLADGARQLASASRTGVVLDADAIPVDPAAAAWAGETGADGLALALSGGEDYELLFGVPRRKRRGFLSAIRQCRGLPVTSIGRLTTEPGTWLSRQGRLEPLPEGFAHF
jgi:thiamine-monophosphate kinase